MIFDNIKNAHLYYGLGENYKTALEYLANNNIAAFEAGKYSIKEGEIFILVQEYATKPESEGRLEAHKDFIDIQFIAKGVEKLGFSKLEDLKTTVEYSKDKDIVFFEGDNDFITAREGDFIVFMPQDAHMPGVRFNQASMVKKAVVKIKIANG